MNELDAPSRITALSAARNKFIDAPDCKLSACRNTPVMHDAIGSRTLLCMRATTCTSHNVCMTWNRASAIWLANVLSHRKFAAAASVVLIRKRCLKRAHAGVTEVVAICAAHKQRALVPFHQLQMAHP